MYQLSFLNIVLQILLPAIRNAFHKAWMQAVITPLEDIRLAFMIWKLDVDVLANTTFQVNSIEKILNDRFNVGNTSLIYIEDVIDEIQPVFLYFNSESQTKSYLYFDAEGQPATYLYFMSEYISQTDFIVWVPDAVYNDMVADGSINKMRKLINIFKMAGKVYEIKPYVI